VTKGSRSALALYLLGMLVAFGCGGGWSAPPSLVLLTLDTTRSDRLGCYGATSAQTPALDALAALGVRYERALTPVPLTLPAHASLLTGLAPPEHGIHDNGSAALPADQSTLATILRRRAYATGAFVSSRVLDHRFGLARGFDVYDDRMPAERVAEFGEPERDAEAVTDAALDWLSGLPSEKPFFLWVHYYDPHSPYVPPGDWAKATLEERYAGEIAHMDRQIGRLLAGLPGDPARHVVAAVGDHGEMLGEHSERAHGFFLYRASLEVPLILAGPGVPRHGVVKETVSSRHLAATLLGLLGGANAEAGLGSPLPGLPGVSTQALASPVYSETFLPATAHGWSPLKAVSSERFRFVLAPRPELYDFVSDPAEGRNLLEERPDVARRLRGVLDELERRWELPQAPRPKLDDEVAEAIRSLGYVSGMTEAKGDALDPKDGILLLRDFEEAKRLLEEAESEEAVRQLEALLKRSPRNVTFLTALATAQQAEGTPEAALVTLRRAVELGPERDDLHFRLADAYRQLKRFDEARASYQEALRLNPRSASSWLGLAATAQLSGNPSEERAILERAEAAETMSAAIVTRLGQIAIRVGELEEADRHLKEAIRRFPGYAHAWWVWGELAEAQGLADQAVTRYAKAIELRPGDARWMRYLGQLLERLGDMERANPYLKAAERADREEVAREDN